MTPGYASGPDTGPWFYARWDSPRYVSIARSGYSGGDLAAFYPVYPLLIRITYQAVVHPLGLDHRWNNHPDSGYALAGLTVSWSMSLLAVLALDRLARDRLGPEAARRAVFYLLIFPTAFYMAQVYTEATYLALSLGMLVVLDRRRWLPAAILGGIATLTRAVGLLLVIPYLFTWLDDWWNGRRPPRLALLGASVPPLAFWGWDRWLDAHGQSSAAAYRTFGREGFGWRGLFNFLSDAAYIFKEPNAVHVALDLGLFLLAASFCLLALRRWPGLALYGLGTLVLPLSSGQLESMNRYVLAAVPIFLVTAQWGRHPAFDRLWTVGSLLLFAFYTVLYVHGFWVG